MRSSPPRSVSGPAGWSPSRLALVTVLQRVEDLTNRPAAEAVRARIDWKYLFGLSLDDPGFDHTVLAEFRGRVAGAGLERVAVDALLAKLAAAGLIKAGGKQRTDSTHVIAAVAALNRLELAGEGVRAAVEALAAAHPDWLARRICVADWTRRYGTAMTSWRPPQSQARRDGLALAYARDGYALLEAVYDRSPPAGCVSCWRWASCPGSAAGLQPVITSGGREVIRRREKEPDGDGLRPAVPGSPSRLTGCPAGRQAGEFWLGYKLHVTETCDDPPACSCRAAAAASPSRRRRRGRRRERRHAAGRHMAWAARTWCSRT